MWGKALGFIGGIFGSSESTNKAMDMVSSGIDAVWFTAEEKSKAAHKMLDLKLKWIQSTSGQNIARRVIAFVIVGLWAYLVLLAAHLYVAGIMFEIDSAKVAADALFKILKEVVNWAFMGIISFYFLVQFTRNK